MGLPTAALLALVVAYCAGTEVLTRWVLSPASTVQRTLEQEIAEAGRLRCASPGQAKTLLVVGNSLLEAAVDFPRLNDLLKPEWSAQRLSISDTSYLDWRFGLLRLLKSGSQPDAIALMLSPRQLVADRIRGSYSAHYMMQVRDLGDVAKAAHLHRTEATSLLLARISLFYAIRAELHNLVLSKVFPGIEDLLTLLIYTPRRPLDPELVSKTAELRLRDLNSIANEQAIPFVLLLPPALREDGDLALVEAGCRTGVPVIRPVSSSELTPSLFRDGHHANKKGAAQYTQRLSVPLRDWLENKSVADVNGPTCRNRLQAFVATH
jgi:hypothetical protein